jgi:hypothetical protein
MLRPTVSRPVCLVVKPHLGPRTRFLLLSDSCGFVDVGRSLRREDGSVVYSRCWPSPAQSFSGPSPAWLPTIFYCLTFETPPTWKARSPYLCPLGTGWPSYTPRHWVPYSSPPTTRRATVEVFEAASIRGTSIQRVFNTSVRTSEVTLRLLYKAQPVNAVKGNNRCLLWKSYGTHKYTLWAKIRRYFNVERELYV